MLLSLWTLKIDIEMADMSVINVGTATNKIT